MTGERTALYARISEDPLGLEKGVTRQVDDGSALITSRGWQPVGEFVDNDVSALGPPDHADDLHERLWAQLQRARRWPRGLARDR